MAVAVADFASAVVLTAPQTTIPDPTMRRLQTLVLTISLLLAAGCAVVESTTTGHSQPEWLTEHMQRKTHGSGTWIADNTSYKSEHEPFVAYALHWRMAKSGPTMIGTMFALRSPTEDAPVGPLWEFRVAWDPVDGVARVFQFGMDGTLGTGTLRRLAAGRHRVEVTLHAKNGGVQCIRDTAQSTAADRITTATAVQTGSTWQKQRAYTWVRK